jgi:transcriptional regulator with XRE-family HTH domain
MSPDEEAKQVKKILGARISRRRDALGLNQEELAQLAKVDRSHMSSIETGKTEPGVWTLMRIAAVLETTSGQLLKNLKSTPSERASDYTARKIRP